MINILFYLNNIILLISFLFKIINFYKISYTELPGAKLLILFSIFIILLSVIFSVLYYFNNDRKIYLIISFIMIILTLIIYIIILYILSLKDINGIRYNEKYKFS
jgi:hypothetical protein